ncbi:MAG: rhomboid family intramembrane serine protease [Spirochaetales bacterium]|jgi:rhomboid protease GluP|nr:rhomboid family intramembrane serine protease [Spirochaetales bacterium]
MKIRYNAPVTLTFALLSTLILAADQLLNADIIPSLFTMPSRSQFSFNSISDWLRLFTHIAGHADWAHLLGNFAFILLLGPILEEKYSSIAVLLMMLVTALVTGLLNGFFSENALLGASGVVFMMILLVSFTNIRNGEIPLTFILVVALYLVKEILAAFDSGDQIAQFAHIAGGVCGSLFGFIKPSRKR